MTVKAAGLVFDFSKTRISPALLADLLALAEAADVAGWRARMAAGEAINTTEHRAVLHMALRGDLGAKDPATGVSVAPVVAETRARIAAFAGDFAAGRLKGSTGLPLNQVLHIGIGGSDLGPRLVVDALRDFARPGVTVRFAGNVDGAEIADATADLDPLRTLIVVVSKTFTTQETMANAAAARAWLAAAALAIVSWVVKVLEDRFAR
jgi:glucose-6-phosphate isomerase